MAQIKVDGVWLATIGKPGSVKWSITADGGLEQISWTMALPPTFSHPALRLGKLVDLKVGAESIGQALLASPEQTEDGWSFVATGLSEELFTGHLCLDGSGNTTSTPDVAIDQAIANGLQITRPLSLSNVPYAQSDNTDSVNYVGDLLDAWATSQSKRWRITRYGEIGAFADPTTPTWYLTPGTAQLSIADDEYYSNLYVRYQSGAKTFATAPVSDPTAAALRRRAAPVDVTKEGIMNLAKATSIGNGLLAKGAARYAVTEAMTPSRLQITTPGGTPAFLPLVRAGQMARLHGVISEQGGPLPYYDFIIGKTDYEEGSNQITIAPDQLAARNLGDILAQAGGV